MSVVRVGATKQYSDNWDKIFSGGSSSTGPKSKGKKSAKAAKKSTKKTAKASGKKSASAKKKSKKK